MSYVTDLLLANEFRTEVGLPPNSAPERKILDEVGYQIVVDLASRLYLEAILPCMNKSDKDELTEFSRQCANVHRNIANWVTIHYADVPCRLTLGHADSPVLAGPRFVFDRGMARECVANPPKRYPGHAWVTLGVDFIIDVTIGTWMTIEQLQHPKCGGIIYGRPESLLFQKVKLVTNARPVGFEQLHYSPVILDADAIPLICPKQAPSEIPP